MNQYFHFKDSPNPSPEHQMDLFQVSQLMLDQSPLSLNTNQVNNQDKVKSSLKFNPTTEILTALFQPLTPQLVLSLNILET